MKFYLKQAREPGDVLFWVYSERGEPVFSVTGDMGSLGGRLCLWDGAGKETARILRIGIPALSQYSISIAGRERLKVTCNLAAPKLRIIGSGWRVRGDVLLRSFDVIDADNTLIMCHGRCWSTMGDCFGLEIPRESNVPACIAIAVVVDLHAAGPFGAALPVG